MEMTIHRALPEDAYEYTLLNIACWRDVYTGIMSDEYLNNMPTEIEERTENHKKALSETSDYEFYYAMYNVF